jgi:hypothetical protein
MQTKFKFSNWQEKINFLLLTLLVGNLIFADVWKIKILGMIIILLSANWLISANWKEKYQAIVKQPYFFVLLSFFLIAVVGLWNTENLKEGGNVIERRLSFLALPVVIFSRQSLSKQKFHYLLQIFVLSVLLVMLYAFRKGFYFLELQGHNIMRDIENDLLLLHRPYYGLYATFAAGIALYFTFFTPFWWKKISWFLLSCTLFVSNFLLICKMAAIASVLGIVVVLFFYGWWNYRKITLSFTLILIALSAIFVYKTPLLRDFIVKIIKAEHFHTTEENKKFLLSFNLRYDIWNATFTVLNQKNNWLTGVGTGDISDELKVIYCQQNHPFYCDNPHEPHHIFFIETLRFGIAGFVVMLLVIAIPFWRSIQQKDYLFLYFMFVFTFCGMSESLLNREHGVLLFTTFITLFWIDKKTIQPKN